MLHLPYPCYRVLLLVVICFVLAGLSHATAAPHRHAFVQHGARIHRSLPRFAAIRAPVANLRRGPGLRYPIKWVYRRYHLPVLILRQFGNWCLLQFSNGTRGWMDRLLLTSHRSFVVTVRVAILRRAPRPTAAVMARLRRGVVGAFHRCEHRRPWCQVSTHGYSGFIRRNQIWGSDFDARRARLRR